MPHKEKFLALYQKFLDGKCTPEEIRLLDEYQDEFDLHDNEWRNSGEDPEEVGQRVWSRLNHNMQTPVRRRNWGWLKVAASLLLIGSAGLYLFNSQSSKQQLLSAAPAPVKVAKATINPGTNKAYLVMTDGAKVMLNDSPDGKIGTQSGIRINKTREGLVVYHFDGQQPGNDTVTTWNTIYTPRGGQYELVLADGTKVFMNAASSLRFPVKFNGDTRNVELTGEAYFEVAKNKHKPFTVNAMGTKVQVLGTHFNVNAYNDNGAVTTTLLEGSVRMERGADKALLTPGQQASAWYGKAGLTVRPADVEAVMGWHNGYFIFHDERVAGIMKQVSRWYDVDIEYTDEVKDREFGGTISKYKDITELLNNMQLTHAIHYKIEGRRVIIMK